MEISNEKKKKWKNIKKKIKEVNREMIGGKKKKTEK